MHKTNSEFIKSREFMALLLSCSIIILLFVIMQTMSRQRALQKKLYQKQQTYIQTISDPERCGLEPQPGPCEAAITSYYFDRESGTCKEFSWGGCEGVRPFETLDKCQTSCLVNQ